MVLANVKKTIQVAKAASKGKLILPQSVGREVVVEWKRKHQGENVEEEAVYSAMQGNKKK